MDKIEMDVEKIKDNKWDWGSIGLDNIVFAIPTAIMIWQDDSPDKWQELLWAVGGMVVVGIPLLCVCAWLNRKPYGLHAIRLILIIGLALLGLAIHFGYF